MLKIRTYLLAVIGISISCLASGATSVPNTFKTGESAKAAEVNENFSALASAIDANATADESVVTDVAALKVTSAALASPEKEYSILSSETLENGEIRTKLYAFEKQNNSANTHTLEEASTGRAVIVTTAQADAVNALGSFTVDYFYHEYSGATYDVVGDSDYSFTNCPDGTQMPRRTVDAKYNVTFRNHEGAFVMTTRSGTNYAGTFGPCADFTTDGGSAYEMPNYFYADGKGLGIYKCITMVAYYGALGGGLGKGFPKIYTSQILPYSSTGVFDRTTNGLWGTYYLEIDAPADCLNLN